MSARTPSKKISLQAKVIDEQQTSEEESEEEEEINDHKENSIINDAAEFEPESNFVDNSSSSPSLPDDVVIVSNDELEIFEIEDFSVVSPWERFIRQCEEQFHKWEIHNQGEGFTNNQKENHINNTKTSAMELSLNEGSGRKQMLIASNSFVLSFSAI